MLKRHMNRSHSVEAVDDSEPEREEARKRRKEERRNRKNKKNRDVLEVIELSDSDQYDPCSLEGKSSKDGSRTLRDGPLASSIAPTSPYFCTNASDVSVNETATDIIDTRLEKSVRVDVTCGPATQVTPAFQSPRSDASTDNGDDESDNEVDERTNGMRTKIGSFAFSATSRAPSIAGRSFQSISDADDAVLPPKSVIAHKQAPIKAAAYLDLPEHQLDSILKCVSCNLKWTIRKTAGHKVAHMRTCARKTHLTEETMKILISREMKVEAQRASESLNTKRAVEELPANTFLEHVVKENNLHRPAKRRLKVYSTIKGVAESRNDILDRAKTIIGLPPSNRLIPDEHETIQPPLATQTFAPSRLNCRSNCASFHPDTSAEPPCTQPFTESGLAAASGKHYQVLELMADSPTLDFPTSTQFGYASKPSSTRRTVSVQFNPDASVDTVSPYRSSSLKISCNPTESEDLSWPSDDGFEYNNEDNSNGYDDAVLTFDPDKQRAADTVCVDSNEAKPPTEPRFGMTTPLILGSSEGPLREKPHRELCAKMGCIGGKRPEIKAPEMDKSKLEQSNDWRSNKDFAGPIMKEKKTRKTSPRKRNVAQRKGDALDEDHDDPTISDDVLFEKFKTMVLENEPLYRRILRYEPICFDVFFKMAQDHVEEHNMRLLSLKAKLRTFLDKEAIHHYGSESGGWGRR